ncbi:cell wall hydrolase [Alkalicoccus saliphilus]|uniref:cell wall hydrolase n=1 Tax=Alkalicoccus saliphilus TaxID=200989 RepID=UPI001FE39B48|nr:cell wall hydrolase [Alkalicoccus saliphilus]
MLKSLLTLIAALCTAVILTAAQPQSAEAALQQEDRGEAVVELQQKLIKMDYLHSEATGYYGPLTNEAVQNFQRDFNLAADGVAGPATMHKLNEVEAAARTVHGEARGESFEGQVAVAGVIKNRVNSSEFPSAISEVVHQQRQFTAVDDGQYYLQPDASSYQAVKEAWQGWDPSQGALYYYNAATATSEWIFTRPVKFSIGKHTFAD